MKTNVSVLEFVLNEYCKGFAEKKDNCWNYSIIARDPNVDVFRNEYYAGFIQGKLQGNPYPDELNGANHSIMAARNNVWNNAHLLDTSAPGYKFPQNFDPSEEELRKAGETLNANYKYLYKWVNNPNNNPKVANAIKRLLMRLLGIYHGMTYQAPLPEKTEIQILRDGKVVVEKVTLFESMNPEKMNELSLKLFYNTRVPSFLDLYLINTQSDFFDAFSSSSKESSYGLCKADRCSAFVKRTTDGDIYWTHNSWCGFFSQSCTISYAILNNDKETDFITQNAYCPGQIGSNMDFGFNRHGICFNETTHRYSYTETKTDGLWICWRAAAAEMFATSIDEFYEYLTADNTGTYQNGYAVIDVNTNETALIEMSYKRFVKFVSDGKSLVVTEKIGKDEKIVAEDQYDNELITPSYIFGVNYPVSNTVAEDLKSTDNRPMRRIQFKERIGTVSGINTAKQLITYIGTDEPLSIYGRWDLGYGTTEYPKTIPDGAVDAKVYSANKVRELLAGLKFTPNKDGGKSSFWMLYGTPEINGKPFIWSESVWAEYKNRQRYGNEVPDRLEGAWNETKLFMD